MKKYFRLIGLLTIPLLLSTSVVFAEEKEPAPPQETGAEKATEAGADVPASQEVEITEDNYRQFMELKDARGQRNILPEDTFKPDSGLQKLDKLPEESQKHLRNQLREIIVQGNQWQPGDEDLNYPYVPSAAARADQPLQNQEAEAWGELVDNYHRREAQIYENSARTRAAMASEDGSDGGSGDGSGNQKVSSDQGTGEAGEVAQDSQRRRSESDGQAGGYAPNGSNEQSSAGVSQNAMEFLKGLGNRGSSGTDGNGDSTSDDDGQAPGQGPAGQQGDSEQSKVAAAAGSPPVTAPDPNAKSVAGTSQNALEFLKGNGSQDSKTGEGSSDSSTGDSGQGDQQGQGDAEAGQQSGEEQKRTASAADDGAPLSPASESGSESTTGTSQNALEYLMGQGSQTGQNIPPDTTSPAGTLSIEDLLKAQGVLNATGTTGTSASDANEAGNPDGNRPEKDGENG